MAAFRSAKAGDLKAAMKKAGLALAGVKPVAERAEVMARNRKLKRKEKHYE